MHAHLHLRHAAALVSLLCLLALGPLASPASAGGCSLEQITAFSGGTSTTFLTGRAIDAAGDTVAFLSDANPTGGNPDGNGEVFLLHLDTGLVTQVTTTSAVGGNTAPSISDDGRLLAFTSFANLGQNSDRNREVYVFNVPAGTFTNITTSSGGTGTANTSADISGDGQVVTYLSTRNPLGTNADGNAEVFTFDRSTGVRDQITTSKGGSVQHPSIDDGGTVLAFASDRNLAGGNGDRNHELFRVDLGNGAISQRTSSTGGQGVGTQVDVDGTGTHITFTSDGDLDPGGPAGGNTDRNEEVFREAGDGTDRQLTTTTGDIDHAGTSISESGPRVAYSRELAPNSGAVGAFVQDLTGTAVQLPSNGVFPLQQATVDDTGRHVLLRSFTSLSGSAAGHLFLATCPAP